MWALTPHEFNLLLRRYRADVRWQEFMAATPAWVTAECNRDRKRHRKPFTLYEWTVAGLAKGRKRKRKPPSKPKQVEQLRSRLDSVMAAFGGRRDDGNDSHR